MERLRLIALQNKAKKGGEVKDEKKEINETELKKIEQVEKMTRTLLPVMEKGEIVEDQTRTNKYNDKETDKPRTSMSSGTEKKKKEEQMKIIPKSKRSKPKDRIYYRRGGELHHIEKDEYQRQLELENKIKGMGIQFERVYLV